MLTDPKLRSQVDQLWDKLWTGGLSNPLDAIEQLSYLLFLKRLDDAENQRERQAQRRGEAYVPRVPAEMRWGQWTQMKADDALKHVKDVVFPWLRGIGSEGSSFERYMQNAEFKINKPSLLIEACKMIDQMQIAVQNQDVQGDLYEYLLSHLNTAGRNGQFRSPRHVIRMMVQMIDPRIGETMCDPAAGTLGFDIAAYEHILTTNSSPEFIREFQRNGLTVRRGLGDKLTPDQRRFLDTGALHAFESDQDIIRMGAMNAVLHGFDQSPIVRRDSIAGSEDTWDEVQFDVIATNPPFSGEVDRNSVKRSLRVDTGTKYLLFLALCMRSLRPGGRCAIVLPNGALFGDTGAHLELKRKLLDEFDLQAVVSLPVGMFQPYTAIPTAFLVFGRTGKPSEDVWIYRVEGDGSSLTGQRKFGPQFRNDFPDLLAKWPARAEEPGRAWRVPAQVIKDKGYNLTLAGLGLIEPETIEHQPPEEILERVAEHEARIAQLVTEMRALLENGNGTR